MPAGVAYALDRGPRAFFEHCLGFFLEVEGEVQGAEVRVEAALLRLVLNRERVSVERRAIVARPLVGPPEQVMTLGDPRLVLDAALEWPLRALVRGALPRIRSLNPRVAELGPENAVRRCELRRSLEHL